MTSRIIKRSVVIYGHDTSVSLEDAFWLGLKEIANDLDMTVSNLVADTDSQREHGNLSSALRLRVLGHFRARRTDLTPANVVDGAPELARKSREAA